MKCFFCEVRVDKDPNVLHQNQTFFARLDDFPVSQGHLEIITRDHVATIFDLEQNELIEFQKILLEAKSALDEKFHPDGYNIGINQGTVAGQSIPHLHIHLIPRYQGDVENPRGGVRNIIPDKGDYSEEARAIGREQYLV